MMYLCFRPFSDREYTFERFRIGDACHTRKENHLNRTRGLLALLLFSPFLCTALLRAATSSNSTIYVSTTGSDSNAGSQAKPFLTIQHAADGAKAGDTINVRGGTYCELLAVTKSGDAAKGYITFRSQPGETAVLDGGCLTPSEGHGGLIELHNVSYVKIEGFEVRNYKTNDPKRTPAGIRMFGSGEHIEILKNNVHDIWQTYPGRQGPGHGANAFGIAIYGTDAKTPVSDLVVDGNEVHHLQTGSSESLVLNGNVTNFRVTHNTVHNNNNIGIDIIGFERTAPDPSVDRARDGIVSDNLVYEITSRGNPAYQDEVDSDGIYVDGGTRVVIERNVMHDVDFGIELASEHGGRDTSHITARNNLIYSCHTAGITIGGYDAKRGTTSDSVIVNNTLYMNDTWKTGTGEFQMQFYLRNNIFKNNIIYVGAAGIALHDSAGSAGLIDGGKTPTVTLDNNVYYYPAGSGAAKWSYNGKDYPSFEDYVKATGNDQHSVFADPRFIDPAKHNFHLQPKSPALGGGAVLGPDMGGTNDLDSTPRVRAGKIDIGAYETH
jgi:hypothetical protein